MMSLFETVRRASGERRGDYILRVDAAALTEHVFRPPVTFRPVLSLHFVF